MNDDRAYIELLESLKQSSSRLLRRFDPADTVTLLSSLEPTQTYRQIGDDALKLWETVLFECGPEDFAKYQMMVMLRFMIRFESHPPDGRYTEEILECFRKSFQRIYSTFINGINPDYLSISDNLLKDLAICRGRMIPAGAQILEPHSGFSRSIMFHGVSQFATLSRALLRCRGNRGFYSYHTHLRELQEFNQSGFIDFYHRVADMLIINENVKGLCTGTWFLDPALKVISPHLSHIRDVPRSGGAKFYLIGVSADTGALSTSKTRQRLYAEGKYIPRIYGMIWHRDDLIAWSKLNKN